MKYESAYHVKYDSGWDKMYPVHQTNVLLFSDELPIQDYELKCLKVVQNSHRCVDKLKECILLETRDRVTNVRTQHVSDKELSWYYRSNL